MQFNRQGDGLFGNGAFPIGLSIAISDYKTGRRISTLDMEQRSFCRWLKPIVPHMQPVSARRKLGAIVSCELTIKGNKYATKTAEVRNAIN
ncbi:hypothetical protein, partial [Pseudomonas viridiflava]|uniref:hypothetical protein n=1 Tax=Pseudomonas viridiflava TaxID=33069 RepID=UPI0013DF61DF